MTSSATSLLSLPAGAASSSKRERSAWSCASSSSRRARAASTAEARLPVAAGEGPAEALVPAAGAATFAAGIGAVLDHSENEVCQGPLGRLSRVPASFCLKHPLYDRDGSTASRFNLRMDRRTHVNAI